MSTFTPVFPRLFSPVACWLLLLGALALFSVPASAAADIVFADFETTSWPAGWTTTGDAFANGPVAGTLAGQGQVTGFQGQRLVNSYLNYDNSQGTLISPTFTINRRYISLLVGGGNRWRNCWVNLLVNGAVIKTEYGQDTEQLEMRWWDVSNLQGQQAQIIIVDHSSDGWGHILADDIVFTDGPVVTNPDITFENFERPLTNWTATGTAFTQQPVAGALQPAWPPIGFKGIGLGSSFVNGNEATGTLTSAPFIINRNYIRLLVGGTAYIGNGTMVNLLIDGKVTYSAFGDRGEFLDRYVWDVSTYIGHQAQIEITDQSIYAHILVDDIIFSDRPCPDYSGVSTYGVATTDEITERLVDEYLRVLLIINPSSSISNSDISLYVYPTWCRVVSPHGIMTVDIAGNTSFEKYPSSWQNDCLTNTYSSLLQQDELDKLNRQLSMNALNWMRALWGYKVSNGTQLILKNENLLSGAVGTSSVSEYPGRILIRTGWPGNSYYYQCVFLPDGVLIRSDAQLANGLSRWIVEMRGNSLSRTTIPGIRINEPPLRAGVFFDPSEYRFEFSGYSFEGESFLDILKRDNPFLSDQFDLSRFWQVDTQQYKQSQDYHLWSFNWWNLYGRINAWRGNFNDGAWEYPQHTVAFHKSFTSYPLVQGMPTATNTFIFNGETIVAPFAISQDPNSQFFDDVDSCHVATFFTHMGMINGVYQYRRQLDIWQRLLPPTMLLGTNNLRHLFLLPRQ